MTEWKMLYKPKLFICIYVLVNCVTHFCIDVIISMWSPSVFVLWCTLVTANRGWLWGSCCLQEGQHRNTERHKDSQRKLHRGQIQLDRWGPQSKGLLPYSSPSPLRTRRKRLQWKTASFTHSQMTRVLLDRWTVTRFATSRRRQTRTFFRTTRKVPMGSQTLTIDN